MVDRWCIGGMCDGGFGKAFRMVFSGLRDTSWTALEKGMAHFNHQYLYHRSIQTSIKLQFFIPVQSHKPP